MRCALKLTPLFFMRPGELRNAEWQWVDFERKEIRYHVSKTRTDHIVPLARQAVELLQELHALTGEGKYLFSSTKTGDRPISNNTINAALRLLGYDTKKDICAHGFRAMARTILHEELKKVDPNIIERQLVHKVAGPLGAAYDRTQFLKERKAIMQIWADYLDELAAGGQIIPIETKTAFR